ncbi:tRNA adenosine(34) deaminase TadA [Leptospirillum ferriphilum]|uniref:tRNA-specific adenosine deaminase n=2 Tax=Leptospirillum ferriphilum TaxID=178606 RepID=A0A1V3SS73_9BACT|nr:tRNA adenosine(34) deaminase TadA [Leptospirillum ferriphilum]AFS52420.1 cytosine/adenosine deaminase [Leptospirillum ferriphilum ML-04]EAY57871.1 MAG: putative zinc-binding cytidine/deoxycytidylate deaminase [Leptospirillum rubarum]OOH69634.1 tRNA-specific adenosine deaminase [Leptospirillum ferriphilum]OOH83857.1 tRNA-specific adenosine deaminase [Leptospirillum ferriphilum]
MVTENSDDGNMDERWMTEALSEAKTAMEKNEIPIGAILVDANGTVLGRGHNQRVGSTDPTAHAEIVALRTSGLHVKNYRLPGTTLYVTVEPCLMCFGALLEARVETVVFGIREPRWGVTGSLYDLQNDPRFPHRIRVREGVLSHACLDLLQSFFQSRRPTGSER